MSADDHGQWLFEFDRPQLHALSVSELFTQLDEVLLRQIREDFRIEFKPNGIHARALAEYFSMWANTSPAGGLIVVGIRNDNEFEGCRQLSSQRINELELTADVYCSEARSELKRVPIIRDDGESDFVLVFWVKYHESRVVRTSDGKAFVRRADRKRELRPDEVRELQAEKGEVSFELEPSCQAFPRDFDAGLVADFVETVRLKKGWDLSHSVEDILQIMHFGVTTDGVFTPNIGCAMLFAHDPRRDVPGCRIRFLRFDGEDEGTGTSWNAVKDEFIDGPISRQVSAIEQQLKSQLRTFSRLGSGGKFFTTVEYPEFAWYEAIVNAIAHRSYGSGLRTASIFVKMFDNRLVVESPGPFPAFVNQQNIFDMHVPRNPFLMEGMFYLKFVRCAHEGTRRIQREMLDNSLPAPEWKQEEINQSLVRVTLRNNINQRRVWVDSDVAKVLGERMANLLTEDEKRCVNFCAEYGSINVSEAVRLVGHDWGTNKKMLERLVTRNILEREKRGDIPKDPRAKYFLRRVPQRHKLE